MTKTQAAISALRNGDYARCLSIVRGFRMGFSKEERRIIEIACDVLHEHGVFYAQLGYDTSAITGKAIEILNDKYNSRL